MITRPVGFPWYDQFRSGACGYVGDLHLSYVVDVVHTEVAIAVSEVDLEILLGRCGAQVRYEHGYVSVHSCNGRVRGKLEAYILI